MTRGYLTDDEMIALIAAQPGGVYRIRKEDAKRASRENLSEMQMKRLYSQGKVAGGRTITVSGWSGKKLGKKRREWIDQNGKRRSWTEYPREHTPSGIWLEVWI